MKIRNGDQSNDSLKKAKGRPKKHKQSTGIITKSCWPKVVILRDSRISKKAEESLETTCLFLKESSSKFSMEEKEYIGKNTENLKEEQGVCLISSSSEIQEDLNAHTASVETEESLRNLTKVHGDDINYSSVEESTPEDGNGEKPIFVDLTNDEKNTWKQTILQRFRDLDTVTRINEDVRMENHLENVPLESRIIIPDSSSKSNCPGSGSVATTLQDRGQYLIPVQPNPSLPIRPVPLVPTRSFRKDCSPLLILSKPAVLDIVEIESVKTVNDGIHKKKDTLNCKDQSSTNGSCNSYVIPKISGVGRHIGVKKKINAEPDNKESRKKKKSQEVDSCYNKEENVENSIKELLKSFCDSNESVGVQNSCTNRYTRVVEPPKEDIRNKLVPPLRLKKIVRAETGECSTSPISTDIEYESNYRIITGNTPGPRLRAIPNDQNDVIYKKTINSSSNAPFLRTDSIKMEYRRNRLMQKLEELQSKALELSTQITSGKSQQNTWLKQAMNRYEKQIANLSKLHNKLSVALSETNEVVNINDDEKKSSEEEFLYVDIQEGSKEAIKCYSTNSSPEPPKLSPRLPINYDNTLPENLRNSPPILPRVCLTISTDQDSIDEDIHDRQRKIWSISEDSMKSVFQDGISVQDMSQNLQEYLQTSPEKQQGTINMNDGSDLDNRENFLNQSKKIIQFVKNNHSSEGNESTDSERTVVQNPEKIEYLEFSETGPVISSVISSADVPENIQGSEMFKTIACEQLSSTDEHILESNFERLNKDNRNIISSSNPLPQVNSIGSTFNRQNLMNDKLQGNSKEETSTDSIRKSNPYISEQFPTLGNWLARISKKQVSKVKTKSQAIGNVSFASPESSTYTPGCEIQKIMEPNMTKNIMNTNPQCGPERWQYNHHQQRQQQLLQHVASVTLSQPVPAVSTLRPAICSPISMMQFYPNNYTIDPYNSYSTIWPYGAYPYQSRLHPSTFPGYHFPIQETLRPLQHVDKRFPTVQESMVRYPPPSIGNPDIRGNSVGNTVSGSLPPLFLPSHSLSSAQQTLPRAPVPGYPSNSQFSENRMFPDVVAAVAAAAVVAAASFDRQRETIPTVSTATPHLPGPSQVISSDATNQTQDSNFGEGHESNTKYQQAQNFLFDRLAMIKTGDNVAHTNSGIGGDTQTPYRMTLVDTEPLKTLSSNEFRNCETPHLGKVTHSLISLHNSTCSNCGGSGPKFKCLGCEMVYYCNERCQERHWNIHVQGCPKKMPKLKKVT